MNKKAIAFTASDQTLTKTDGLEQYASNTVSYVEATFTLGTNWTGFDSVRAVWHSQYYDISTVLNAQGKCDVPAEVMYYKSKVFVNLVGITTAGDEISVRLTTYPILAFAVDSEALVEGTETGDITPSQFDQFVSQVSDDAASAAASAAAAAASAASLTVDPALSPSSTNPVQNKVITNEIFDLKEDLEVFADGLTPVLYNKVPNTYIAIATGDYTPSNGWTSTSHIPVKDGATIYYTNSAQSAYNVWFDENHEKIGGNFIMYAGTLPDGSTRYMPQPPTGAKFFALSNSTEALDDLKIWYKSELIDDENVSNIKTYSSEKIRQVVAGEPYMILPSECYAVVGSEFNIYYENILVCENIENYDIFPIITPYTSITYDVFSDRLRIEPTAAMVGDYTIRFNVKKKNQSTFQPSIYQKEIALHIIPKMTLSNKRVIFIGDSLTNAGYYPYEIQDVLSSNGVTSLGTRTSNPWIGNVQKTINHEGRGGWSAMDYTSLQASGDVPNAFWNPNTNAFDFSYYMSQQGYSRPDLVFINLGTNSVEQTENIITSVKTMINSIHSYDSNIPILVSLITPPATQDGFTYVSHGSSALQFEINQRKLNERYIEEFDNVMANVYVSPVYFNLDRYYDYSTSQFPVSARNPELVTLQINNVHPSQYGYYKFADVYWAMIQHLLG